MVNLGLLQYAPWLDDGCAASRDHAKLRARISSDDLVTQILAMRSEADRKMAEVCENGNRRTSAARR